MMRLALLGRPVTHSRSPAMMRAALDATALDGVYIACDVAPEGLGDAVRGLAALGFDGANVTLPHKVAVMQHLSRIDDAARRVGAVNTLVREGDGFAGYNTDVDGVRGAWRAHGVTAEGARGVVLGAGGAARAAAVALALDGAATVWVLARRLDAAEAVCVALRDGPWQARAEADTLGSVGATCALGTATLVVQATSCGMRGGPTSDALLEGAPLRCCLAGTLAMDLVYTPAETPWMREAARVGMRVLPGAGAEMLARQGATAFARWTGRDAPLAVMRAALGLSSRGDEETPRE